MPENNNHNSQYEKINLYDVMSRLGNIEGKLDQALATIDDHGKRINNTERTQDQIVGKISIVGTIFGFIGGIIVSIFKDKL